jgi:hypothetical protein
MDQDTRPRDPRRGTTDRANAETSQSTQLRIRQRDLLKNRTTRASANSYLDKLLQTVTTTVSGYGQTAPIATSGVIYDRCITLVQSLGDPDSPAHIHAPEELVSLGVAALPALFNALNPDGPWLIAYRAAEILESRRAAFLPELAASGLDTKSAARQVDLAVDRLVHYAGWTDKLSAVFGSVNPVSSPHWNVTSPEPCGVVAVVCPDEPSLLSLVTLLAIPLVTGNSVIALASDKEPLSAISLAEVLAVSDLPAGTVNILTGTRAELAPALASHLEVNAVIDGSGDSAIAKILASGSASNLKRVHHWQLAAPEWEGEEAENPYRILETVEFKTAWHPSAH